MSMDFLLGTVFGIFITYIILRLVFRLIVSRVEAMIEDTFTSIQGEVPNNNLVKARVEDINGVFYLYNNDTNVFIAQGTSIQEIQNQITAMRNTDKIVVAHGDEATLKKLNGTFNS
jgi:hypothetical protein